MHVHLTKHGVKSYSGRMCRCILDMSRVSHLLSSSICSPHHLGLVPRLQPDIQLPHIRRKTIPTLLLDRASILAIRKPYLKGANQIRRHAPKFHHRQLLTDAVVHARAEGHERALVDHGFGLLVGPALRHELEGLGEVSWISLQAVDWHPDDDVAGNVGLIGECDAFWWSFALNARGDLELVSELYSKGKSGGTYSRV